MGGQGPRGNNGTYSALCGLQSLLPLPPRKLGLSGANSHMGGLVHPVGLSNDPLGVSPCTSIPTGVLNKCPEALFSGARTLVLPGQPAALCAVSHFTISASLGLPVATPWLGSSSCRLCTQGLPASVLGAWDALHVGPSALCASIPLHPAAQLCPSYQPA
ncbi:hypothetical protein HJG60_012168 [Phyllostomus discolor]|uniref:Uncharacterized protein n=1 Tax=Phyllostomus discolor TaxID=89673 RepID=A0A833ZDY3_9CHIR|nr:hypothetical protein HJG60_012168 [Phyllostomus discolor]